MNPRIARRLLYLGLCLLLALPLTACGKEREHQAPVEFELGRTGKTEARTDAALENVRQNVQEAARGNTDALPVERPQKAGRDKDKKPQTGTIYDDSLVREVFSETAEARTDWGIEYTYSVSIPEILSDAPDAAEINREIMLNYGEEAKQPPQQDAVKYSISWESHWYGSLLSLVMIHDQPDGSPMYEVFFFDFEAGKRLDRYDVLERLGSSWEELQPWLIRAAAQASDRMMAYESGFDAGFAAQALAMRAQSVTAAANMPVQFYPNGDGTLTAYVPLCTYAGAGWVHMPAVIDLSRRFQTLSCRSGFITAAVTEDGGVEIRYEKGGDIFSSEDYRSLYGFEYGRAYQVEGCFGTYKDIFIGNIGSGYEPYLFLLTEENTVEYIDIFLCARYDTYICGGPAYGLDSIEGFREGMAQEPDYSYQTVFAVDAAGGEHDLSWNVYLSGAMPYNMQADWADGSGSAWCRLSFDELEGCAAQAAGGEHAVNYRGFPIRIGMNEAGLVYALDLWDDNGQGSLSICALLPAEEMLCVELISGDALFGLTPGECRYMTRVYG